MLGWCSRATASASARKRARSTAPARSPGQDHLQGNQPIQADLPRPVDDAHAAAAELTQDLVAGYRRGGDRDLAAVVSRPARSTCPFCRSVRATARTATAGGCARDSARCKPIQELGRRLGSSGLSHLSAGAIAGALAARSSTHATRAGRRSIARRGPPLPRSRWRSTRRQETARAAPARHSRSSFTR